MKGMESTQRTGEADEYTDPATKCSVSTAPLASSHISRLIALGRRVEVRDLITNTDNRGVFV
jgi:hypothetical protein